MDNIKTGELISTIRKQKNMTQKDIADKLNITSKAVSKWERGLSFPSVDILEKLAEVLGISVIDILSGEIVESQNIVLKADDVSIQVLKKEKKARRNFFVAITLTTLLLIVIILRSLSPIIFQCGNPIPYLIASMSISEQTPFVEVEKHNGIYISKRGECPELFEYVKEKWNVNFVEQAGSGFIFTNGVDTLVVTSEIYWGKFTVWKIPQHTLQSQ